MLDSRRGYACRSLDRGSSCFAVQEPSTLLGGTKEFTKIVRPAVSPLSKIHVTAICPDGQDGHRLDTPYGKPQLKYEHYGH
jgi:hypothetical protein